MRLLVASLLLFASSACANIGPIPLPENIQPIASETTIGSEPIEKAVVTELTELQLLGRAEGAVSMTRTTRSKFDARFVAERVLLTFRHLGTEIDTEHVPPRVLRRLRSPVLSKDAVTKIFYDRTTDETFQSVAQDGKTTFPKPPLGLLGQFFTRHVLTGRSVRQGQRLFEFKLSQIFGDGQVPPDLTVVGTAEGIGTVDGRKVIAVHISGSAKAKNRTTTVSGLYFADIETGFYIDGEIRIIGMMSGKALSNLIVNQRIVL